MSYNTTSILVGREIPLNAIYRDPVHILLDVSAIYEYNANNQRTDKVIGFSYTVANLETFDRYKVKVLGDTPLITKDELQSRRDNNEKIYIEFIDAVIKMYWSKDKKSYADTISAKNIEFTEYEL